MALQSSGAISFGNLASEFGGASPHSFSEYYLGGANVPTTVSRDADAASLTGSVSDVRGGIYTTAPVINSGGVLYKHNRWADNGSVGTGDVSFTVNKTGTYSYSFSHYCQQASRTSNHTLFVDGTQVVSEDLTAPANGSASVSGTFSATAGDTIRITCTWNSAGWASSSVTIGGSTTSNDDVDVTVNTGIPTSGLVRLGQFYNGTNS
jgi:hypothetical protein